MLCKSDLDIISKFFALEVPDDKEEVLSLAISEANKSSNTILERREQWFDYVKVRLAEVNDIIINIDDLVARTESRTGYGKKEVKQAPPVGAKVSTASDEGSGSNPAPVPSAAPLPSGGKYTPLAPAPGTLEWGCTPTALYNWFQA